jgi:hypothetical protein
MTETKRARVILGLGLTSFFLAGVTIFFPRTYLHLFIIFIQIAIMAVVSYLLWKNWQVWRAKKRAATLVPLVTGVEWNAVFEGYFEREYPRWRQFVATQTPQAQQFKALKLKAEKLWPDLLPRARQDWLDHPDDLVPRWETEAMMHIVSIKSGQYAGLDLAGFTLHHLYRDWEVAQTDARLGFP